LGAAKKSTELGPAYYSYYTLADILLKMKKYDEALKAAERAVELVKPEAAKYSFPTKQYEALVKQIRDAQGKEKQPTIKK
jgi:tetratricopeptide (TPR) repeat protein